MNIGILLFCFCLSPFWKPSTTLLFYTDISLQTSILATLTTFNFTKNTQFFDFQSFKIWNVWYINSLGVCLGMVFYKTQYWNLHVITMHQTCTQQVEPMNNLHSALKSTVCFETVGNWNDFHSTIMVINRILCSVRIVWFQTIRWTYV